MVPMVVLWPIEDNEIRSIARLSERADASEQRPLWLACLRILHAIMHAESAVACADYGGGVLGLYKAPGGEAAWVGNILRKVVALVTVSNGDKPHLVAACAPLCSGAANAQLIIVRVRPDAENVVHGFAAPEVLRGDSEYTCVKTDRPSTFDLTARFVIL